MTLLWPGRCPGCDRPGPAPCRACRARLVPVGGWPPPPGVDACAAAFAYDGVGRRLVAAVKYRNQRAVLPWAGEVLAGLARPRLEGAPAVVTWAPTAPARRRARGYDQARLLARAVAAPLGAPSVACLRRLPGAPQTGRDRTHRLAGPAFGIRGPVPPVVVVVDDVVTTGGTLAAAARALRAAGAVRVVGVALAATPRVTHPTLKSGPAAAERRR